MYEILLIAILLVVIYCLIIHRGINTQCQYCYKNGSHFHPLNFSVNENHGPKINGNFSHEMCKICMQNPGCNHFHLF